VGDWGVLLGKCRAQKKKFYEVGLGVTERGDDFGDGLSSRGIKREGGVGKPGIIREKSFSLLGACKKDKVLSDISALNR